MPYKVIAEKCDNCAKCDPECGPSAISEKDGKRWINAVDCVDCGVCAGVCEKEAIVEE